LVTSGVGTALYRRKDITGEETWKKTLAITGRLKEKVRYCNLIEEAPDRILWRTRFGRGYGPAARQSTERKIVMPETSIVLPGNSKAFRQHRPCSEAS
jgi:hypothetical protein